MGTESSSRNMAAQDILNRSHPLQFITPSETSRASATVKNASKTAGTAIRFKNISLHEPPKALLLPYLNAEAQGVAISERPFVPRCLDVIWSSENERQITESVVSLDSNSIVDQSGTAPGQHGPIDKYVLSLSISFISTNILQDLKFSKPLRQF